VAPGQRTVKSGGRPGANGKDADTQSQTCVYLVRKLASADASRSELRGLTQNSVTARREAEAEFTSSSGGVRALSVNAKKELSGEERLETVPSRVK